jgi:hypothetical protein
MAQPDRDSGLQRVADGGSQASDPGAQPALIHRGGPTPMATAVMNGGALFVVGDLSSNWSSVSAGLVSADSAAPGAALLPDAGHLLGRVRLQRPREVPRSHGSQRTLRL